MVAKASLSDLVLFSNDWTGLLDVIYKEYVRARFGTTLAWHVATMWGKRILKEVSLPRVGVQKNFKAGKITQIKGTIFYSTLRSLDVMNTIRKVGLKNHPVVSSELVKFLAVNTEYQSIKDLQTLTTELKDSVKDVDKHATSSIKAASTASNRIDSLQDDLKALTARLKKLEDKKWPPLALQKSPSQEWSWEKVCIRDEGR